MIDDLAGVNSRFGRLPRLLLGFESALSEDICCRLATGRCVKPGRIENIEVIHF